MTGLTTLRLRPVSGALDPGWVEVVPAAFVDFALVDSAPVALAWVFVVAVGPRLAEKVGKVLPGWGQERRPYLAFWAAGCC